MPVAGEVRVRVRYAGICGSDVHILHGKNPFVVYPRVIGHEFVGRIDAVGEGVDRARVGELVAVDPVISCGRCHACLAGRRNVCRNLQVIGVHRDGGFSEYMTAPASNAYTIPAGVSETSSAIIEPFAVAAQVTSRTGVFESDVALIYGAGPVGLNILQVLKGVHGIRALITDQLDERLELAIKCGADANDVINTKREVLAEALAKRGVDGGPTLIYDAVGHPSILEEAVRIAAPAGRIGVLGLLDASVRDSAAGAHEEGVDPLCVAPQLLDVSACDRLGRDGPRTSRPHHHASHRFSRCHGRICGGRG